MGVFIGTFHAIRLTLTVLGGLKSGAFCWEPVDVCVDFFLINYAGNFTVITNIETE
jgi:hypothetical protein